MTPVNIVISSFILCVFTTGIANASNIKNDIHLRSNHCRIRRQAKSCSLPPPIENGTWSIYGFPNRNFRPGELVESGTILEIKCNNGIQIRVYPICGKDGNWINGIPSCTENLRCNPVISSSTTFVTCTLRGRQIDCSLPLVEGTYAKFSCDPFHELSTTHDTMLCSQGKWEGTEPKCTAVCGENSTPHKKLIVNGEDAKPINYPWTIALYRLSRQSEYLFKCSGTLISERIIVTAAHCVSKANGEAYPENLYIVAAGKYYRNYTHPNDTDAEFSEIEKIIVHNKYKGSTLQYEYDIAILVTKNDFNTSDYIRRICVEWDQYSSNDDHLVGANGTITGWGNRASGRNLSETLQKVVLPYVGFATCYSNMPDKFKMYIRDDKMCAGYLNKGIAVCEGDSGGGYAFPNPRDKDRYYLRGVVSSSAQVFGSCDENKYSLHTRVADYIDFIARYERTYRGVATSLISKTCQIAQVPCDPTTTVLPATEQVTLIPHVPSTSISSRTKQDPPIPLCVLPLQIKNGKWEIHGQNNTSHYQPGDRIGPGTTLKLTCNKGYDITIGSKIRVCNNAGDWEPDFPKCLPISRLCWPLASTETTLVTCFYQGREVNCSKAVEGTLAIFECAPFYELSTSKNILHCKERRWQWAKPTCNPICGENAVPTKELIIGGKKVIKNNYPWRIALYRHDGNSKYTHICGGSLINQRVIVTAADCVTDRPFSKGLYKAAAGKFFDSFNEPNDTDAEFSDIEKIHVHESYQGRIFDYEYDIAVLVTKEPFNVTKYIQRVCIDLFTYVDDELFRNIGIVTGWEHTNQDKNSSRVIKDNFVPYVTFETCLNKTHDKYKKYLTRDKMCVGNSEKGIGVCNPDSGGGLVFRQPNDKDRFYLRGVVINPAPLGERGCEDTKYAISTKISIYYTFIRIIEHFIK